MVPSGNALVGIADRAGYPVLTVPAGYGTGSAGRNPIGVTFVGTAFSEPKLLADGYAFEQATNVRLAPSFTNPSMWRCVPGSTFFSGELCNPGDRLITPTCTHDATTGPMTVAPGRDAVPAPRRPDHRPADGQGGRHAEARRRQDHRPAHRDRGRGRRDLRHDDHRPAHA